MKWADLCPSSVLFLFILSSWGPTVAFTSIFTSTIPASLKLDMSYKQTIRLWGWDRDRQKVWGIAKLEDLPRRGLTSLSKCVRAWMVSEMLTLETALADQALKLSSSSLLFFFFPCSLLPSNRGLILLCVMDCMQRVHHFQVQTACGLNAWNCVRWTVQYPQEYSQICVCRLVAVRMITKVPFWFISVFSAILAGWTVQCAAYEEWNQEAENSL